jgi:alpha-beta hydrolase superfamily lysophospholipase
MMISRTLVDREGMLQDLEQFVDIVMKQAPDTLKWFCVGQSMAGAVAILFSHRSFQRNFSHYGAFGGCVAIAPLVTVDKPPYPVMVVLNSIASYFPHCLVPGFVSDDIADEEVWKTQELVAWHMTHDVRTLFSRKMATWI